MDHLGCEQSPAVGHARRGEPWRGPPGLTQLVPLAHFQGPVPSSTGTAGVTAQPGEALKAQPLIAKWFLTGHNVTDLGLQQKIPPRPPSALPWGKILGAAPSVVWSFSVLYLLSA